MNRRDHMRAVYEAERARQREHRAPVAQEGTTTMDYEKKYREALARAENAEKALAETRQEFAMYDALRQATVPANAVKYAVQAIRKEAASFEFKDSGEFWWATLDGKVFKDPAELAKAFVTKYPNFTQAHSDAVRAARGWDASGGNASGGGATPVNNDSMNANDLAAAGLERYMAGKHGHAKERTVGAHKEDPTGDLAAQVANGIRKAGAL